jgi:hypothetical protein
MVQQELEVPHTEVYCQCRVGLHSQVPNEPSDSTQQDHVPGVEQLGFARIPRVVPFKVSVTLTTATGVATVKPTRVALRNKESFIMVVLTPMKDV